MMSLSREGKKYGLQPHKEQDISLKKRRSFWSFLTLLIWICLSLQSSFAATFYVSTSGNNTNNGSIGSPWRNVQYGVNQAQSGDTVNVRAGTYNEYVIFTRSGIILSGYQNEAVILDGTALNWRYAFDLGSFDDITIEKFVIQNFIRDGIKGYGVVGWSDNDNITLRNLTISGAGAAVKFQGGVSTPPTFPTDPGSIASGITIENLSSIGNDAGLDFGPGTVQDVVIRDVNITGPSSGNNTANDGIAVEMGRGITIEDASVQNNSGDGIDLKADNVTVLRSAVTNNERDGVKLWGANATLAGSSITGHGLTSLVLEGAGPYSIIENSIGNTTSYGYTATLGPYESSSPSQITLTNNIFFNQVPENGGVLIYFSPGAQVTARGNTFYQPYRADAVLDANYSSNNSIQPGYGKLFGVVDFNAATPNWPTGFTNNIYRDSAGRPYELGSPVLTDIWVDPINGNDGNSGNSRASALRTVSAAWNRIPMGTTLSSTGYRIRLVTGTYSASNLPNYWESRWGTYRFPVILEAADGPGTAVLSNVNIFDCRYMYLIGLRVQESGGDVIHFEASHHILLRDNIVVGDSGVQETIKMNQCQFVYLENNDVSRADQNPIDFVAVQYGHIVNNKIHDGLDWCMYLKGGSSDFTIDGNEIYNCGGTGSEGGFLAGQGTGFEYMASPWLHYEAYNIKFTNNDIHDSSGPGMGVNGGYNILMAYNTLYRVGSFSHGVEFSFGSRTCDGDLAACQSRNSAGGWGPRTVGPDEPIPNRNVYFYNNLLYNPPGIQSQWQHFTIQDPRSPGANTNIPNPSYADANLGIRGNVIWNGPPDLPLGIEGTSACQSDNPTCNETQLRADNSINALSSAPQLDSNQRPTAGSNVYNITTYAVPAFSGTDRTQPPLAGQGLLSNIVSLDRDRNIRSTLSPPGAYIGPLSTAPSIAININPASQSVTAGNSADFSLNLARTNFTGEVNFSASGLGTGTTASFNPTSSAGNSSTLTLSTIPTAASGTFVIQISASNGSDLTASATVSLTINLPGNTVPSQWSSRGLGGGGALFSPSFNPHQVNEFFISCDMGELFRTQDLGASWTTLDFREIQGNRNSQVQFTENPSLLFTLDYTSIDGGDTVRPARSHDGGATWVPLPSSSWPTDRQAYTLHVDPSNSNRMVVSADYDQIYYSNDGGNTFTQQFSTADGGGAHVAGVFFDGNNIFIGTNLGLLVSTDNGATFNLSAVTGIPSSEYMVSFAGAKQGSTVRFFCATSDSVWAGMMVEESFWGFQKLYSLDWGQGGWTPRMTGISAGHAPVLVSMAQNNISTAYAAGQNNDLEYPVVYKTTNAGSSWQSILSTDNNQNISTGWSGDQGDRQWSYGGGAIGFSVALNDANKAAFTDYGFVHLTTDGGSSWRQAYLASGDQNPPNAPTPTGKNYRSAGLEDTTCWQVLWASPSDLFAGFSDIRGIRSTDAGQSWSFNYTGHTDNSMYRIVKHPTTGVLYGATSSVHDLYQSTYLQDSRIDGGGGKILFSSNDGASWQTLHDFTDPVIWLALDPNNPNRLYASVVNSSVGGIYVSSNIQNGASSNWTKLANPPRTEGHPFNIHVLNDGTLVATYSGRRNSSGAFTASSGVFISTDGGSSWIDRSANPGMYYWTKDLVIDPFDTTQNTWYAGVFSGWGGPPNGLGGLYKTTNRGQTWSRIFSPDRVSSCTLHPANANVMYVTTETDGLWVTSNLSSPTPVFNPVTSYPFGQPERVFFNPFDLDEIWVTSFGNGLRVGNAGTDSPPGVILSASPGSQTFTAGSGASFIINLSRTNFSGDVTLNISGLPSGVSAEWSENPTAGTSTTVNLSSDASVVVPGLYTITFEATASLITIDSILADITINILDSDGDGLSDTEEETYGTDPNDPDSDDDSFNDGQEVNLGTNPLDSQSLPAVLKITADNIYTLSINGERIRTDSSWSTVEQNLINVENGPIYLAIQADDVSGIAGMICQIEHGSSLQVSDFTWQVANSASALWETPSYDHSTWLPATEHFSAGKGPWGNLANEFNSKAFWIWSSDANQHNRVYFWTQYNPNQNGVFTISADNEFEYYHNGEFKGSASQWSQAKIFPDFFQPEDTVAVYSKDQGAVAGLIGELVFRDESNSIRRMFTDDSWRVSPVIIPDWLEADFDDSTWTNATPYGSLGASPWGKPKTLSGISSFPQWIWTNDRFNHNDAWFLKTIPNATLNFVCDNRAEVYHNGERVAFSDDWSRTKSVGLLMNTDDIIAFKGTDLGGIGALMASIDFKGQMIVSNSTWKISNVEEPGWNEPGFDDSQWNDASMIAAQGASPWGNVSGMDASARWIWSQDPYQDDTVFFRFTIGQDNSIPGETTVQVSADNEFYLYHNGNFIGSGTRWDNLKTFILPMNAGDILAVDARDSGYMAGLILRGFGAFNFQSDSSWLTMSANTPEPGWTSINFDDSLWVPATGYGAYGTAPWGTRVMGFPSNSTAQWIWSNRNQTGSSNIDPRVFFRKRME